jgi:hypothetical protein
VTAIDIHQHLWPEELVAALSRRRKPPRLTGAELVLREGRFPLDPAANDPAVRLAQLDEDEIDVAVLSLQPTLGIGDLPAGEQEELELAWLRGTRELVSAGAGRWRAFAPGRVEEGFVGASVGASALADLDTLRPLLDELETRSSTLFVHPGAAAPPPADPPEWWTAIVDYTAQMHVAYFRWLAQGRRQWPTLRVAFAILAGGAPFQLERLAQRGRDVRSMLDPDVYLDVATYSRRSIELCAQTFGADQLLYGSDRPVVDPAPTLKAVKGFGESMAKLITVDNPRAFLR